jgi:hypothetical protein
MEEQAALLGMWIVLKERAHSSGGFSLTGFLDLDHFSPIVGEKFGAVWAGDVPGQIQNLDI